MKIDQFVDTEILSDPDLAGQDYGIAADGMGMAIRAFYQYARPIEAVVREIASNAFDAHREAALIPTLTDDQLRALGYSGDLNVLRAHFAKWKERDVEIEITAATGFGDSQRKLSVRDYGCGISPVRMKNIMTKFFSSTKRSTNEMIGAFGLGSKSPLGYTNVFTMVTWFFGVRYEYLIHTGAASPRLELVDQQPDTRRNGTEVIVPIKDEADVKSFQAAIIEQLRYFNGFKVIGVPGFADKAVIRGKHFVYKPDGKLSDMHICLGKVYYPLDFAAIPNGYSYRQCPVGLYFDIGELPVVWNRESIEYTQDTKTLILRRIQDVKNELQELWDRQFKDIVTAEQFIQAHGQGSTSALKLAEGVVLPNVGQMVSQDVKWPGHPKVCRDPLHLWQVSKKVENGYTSKVKYHCSLQQLLLNDTPFFFSESNVSRPNVNSWLYEGDQKMAEYYLVTRRFNFDPNSSDMASPRSFSWQLNHQQHWANDAEKMSFITTSLEIEEYLIDKSKGKYDDIEIPEEWSKTLRERSKLKRKAAVSLPKEAVKVRAQMPLTLRVRSNGDYGNSAFFLYPTTIGEVEKYKGLWIYGTQHELEDLDVAKTLTEQMFKGNLWAYQRDLKEFKYTVVKVAVETQKILDEIPNAIHVKAFLSQRRGFMRRWLTLRLLASNYPSNTNTINLAVDKIPDLVPVRAAIARLAEYQKGFQGNTIVGPPDRINHRLAMLEKELLQDRHWDHSILMSFKAVVAACWNWSVLNYIQLHYIPADDLRRIVGWVGRENPELIRRNALRQGRLTNQS